MKQDPILTGVGFSKGDSSYESTKEAARAALKGLNGKVPKLSLVFYAGAKYNPREINRALTDIFKGTEFVGGSTDAVVYKDDLHAEGIVIACLYSDYLHFSCLYIIYHPLLVLYPPQRIGFASIKVVASQ